MHLESGLILDRKLWLVNQSDMLIDSDGRKWFASSLIVLLLACTGLAACGGSSSSSKGKVGSVGTVAASTGTGRKPASVQPGNGPPNRVQGARLKKSAFYQAFTKFVACLRQNGVNIPASKTVGSGPLLNTKGIEASSTKFQTAWTKCRSNVDLGRAFHLPEAGEPRGIGRPR
jgi:hypothetical protein